MKQENDSQKADATPIKEWTVGRNGYNANLIYEGDKAICQVFGLPLHTRVDELSGEKWEEGFRNARIIAEAGTVEAETGLTPRQLEQRLDACVVALEGILGVINESRGVVGFHLNGDDASWSEFQDLIKEMQDAIDKAAAGKK